MARSGSGPATSLRVGETDLRLEASSEPSVAYAVASDTGRRRRRNEDNYVVAPPLFAVADGMGGAQAGEVASKLAAAPLEDGRRFSGSGAEQVAALIQEANRRVWQRLDERSDAPPAWARR